MVLRFRYLALRRFTGSEARVEWDRVWACNQQLTGLINGDTAPIEDAVVAGMDDDAFPVAGLRREDTLIAVPAKLNSTPKLIKRSHTPHVLFGQCPRLKRELRKWLRRRQPVAE